MHRRGIEQGIEQGIERGKAQSILLVLAARGLTVDEPDRARILSCTAPAELDRWLRRAPTVAATAEIFTGD